MNPQNLIDIYYTSRHTRSLWVGNYCGEIGVWVSHGTWDVRGVESVEIHPHSPHYYNYSNQDGHFKKLNTKLNNYDNFLIISDFRRKKVKKGTKDQIKNTLKLCGEPSRISIGWRSFWDLKYKLTWTKYSLKYNK